MRINDIVTLAEQTGKVIKLSYKLDLEFTSNQGQISTYEHVINSSNQHVPQRGEWFPDEATKVALIHQAEPTGCEIEIINDENDNNIIKKK